MTLEKDTLLTTSLLASRNADNETLTDILIDSMDKTASSMEKALSPKGHFALDGVLLIIIGFQFRKKIAQLIHNFRNKPQTESNRENDEHSEENVKPPTIKDPDQGPYRSKPESIDETEGEKPPLSLSTTEEKPQEHPLVAEFRDYYNDKLAETELYNYIGKRIEIDESLTKDDIEELLRIYGVPTIGEINEHALSNIYSFYKKRAYSEFILTILQHPNTGTKTIKNILQIIFYVLKNEEPNNVSNVWKAIVKSCLEHSNWNNDDNYAKIDCELPLPANYDILYYKFAKLNVNSVKYFSDYYLSNVISIASSSDDDIQLLYNLVSYAFQRTSANMFMQLAYSITRLPKDVQKRFLEHPSVKGEVLTYIIKRLDPEQKNDREFFNMIVQRVLIENPEDYDEHSDLWEKIAEVIAECPEELQVEFFNNQGFIDDWFYMAVDYGLKLTKKLKIAIVSNPRPNNGLIVVLFDDSNNTNDPEFCDAVVGNPIATPYILETVIPNCTKDGLYKALNHPNITDDLKVTINNRLSEMS